MTGAIISLSEFKSDASRLLAKMREKPGVLVLTQNGRGRAVVQDYEQYQADQQVLLMLKLPVQGETDIAQGRVIPQDEVFADLRNELAGLGPDGGADAGAATPLQRRAVAR